MGTAVIEEQTFLLLFLVWNAMAIPAIGNSQYPFVMFQKLVPEDKLAKVHAARTTFNSFTTGLFQVPMALMFAATYDMSYPFDKGGFHLFIHNLLFVAALILV